MRPSFVMLRFFGQRFSDDIRSLESNAQESHATLSKVSPSVVRAHSLYILIFIFDPIMLNDDAYVLVLPLSEKADERPGGDSPPPHWATSAPWGFGPSAGRGGGK